MGVMLSDQVIRTHLEGLCQHLRRRNAEQARRTLDLLNFERLLRPIEDETHRLHFIDPAAPFGVERVHKTGKHLQRCRSALVRGDIQDALDSAEEALARWT
jgi:hypothetical protein